jgi:hypothetical protein
MNEMPDNRSLTSLISDLAQQAGALVRTEAQLLRTEISEKMESLGISAVEILAGAICVMAALIILLQALVIAITKAGLGAGWSSLLVGGVVAILGIILMLNGRSGLTAGNLTPDRTKRQLEDDARILKEQVK